MTESRLSLVTVQDYEYDLKDQVVLSTAFRELKEDDRTGFRYGLVSILGSYFLMDRTTKWSRFTKFSVGFLFGVTMYNLYTHKSRSYYGHLAEKFNKKTSIALNEMMS